MKSFRSSMFGLVIAATAQFAAASPQLVINGNFETGDFTAWSQGGEIGYQTISGDTLGNPLTFHAGSVFSDGAFPGNGYLSQSITTTAGSLYTLQFDLKRFESDNRQPNEALNNYAEVMFGGLTIFSETNVTGDWIHYTFGSVAGTGGAETLRIASLNQFDYNQWDNFSLTANDLIVDPPVDGQAPEPASIAMLLLGLGVLGFTRRKQA